MAIPSWRTIFRRKQLEPDDRKGRCFYCGFLCKMRLQDEMPIAFYSIDYLERLAGKAYEHVGDTGAKRDTVPWCFRSVDDFTNEIARIMREVADRRAAALADPKSDFARLNRELAAWQKSETLATFEEDRHCSEWIEFVPGLDPVAHLGGKAMQDAERRAQGIAKLQILLAVGEVTISVVAVAVAVVLAITFASRSDTTNNYFVPVTPIVSEAAPSPVAVELTPTPSLESIPGRAKPQPQQAP